jgi:hypothetical protein
VRHVISTRAGRQLRLLAAAEVVQKEMIRAVARRHVDQAAAVRRPRQFGFFGHRCRQADGVAAVLGRDREDLAVHGERGLFAVRRDRQLLDLIAEAAMLDRRRGRRAAQRDRHLARLTAGGIHRPDPEIALEGDRLAVFRDRRPQHAAVFECSQRFRGARPLRRRRPDVPRAAADRT